MLQLARKMNDKVLMFFFTSILQASLFEKIAQPEIKLS